MIHFLRRLSGRERSRDFDRTLGMILAFVAGAVNAGGFVAVARYTSHMTGVVSSVADSVALGDFRLAGAGAAAFAAFLLGAATSALLINWARRRGMHGQFALPLMLEAALLLAFGVVGSRSAPTPAAEVSAAVLLLCYTMGLQNAVITKASNAEIRTTHMTGLTTDLGIQVGRALYWNKAAGAGEPVAADRDKMRLLASLLGLFALGGVLGALAFKRAGFVAVIPLAATLFAVAAVPVLDDLTR